MSVVDQFREWVKEKGDEAPAVLGIGKAKLMPGGKPSADALAAYVEKVWGPINRETKEWTGRNVVVCVPVLDQVPGPVAFALCALFHDFGKDIRLEMEWGDSMVHHSRDIIAHAFMESGAEWSLWLDADIIPPIGRAGWFKKVGALGDAFPERLASAHVVHRLMKHGQSGKKVVGGLYFGRNAKGTGQFAEGMSDAGSRKARTQFDGVEETAWAATGCLLVHRSVYEDIRKKFPENATPQYERRPYSWFLPMKDAGEDAAFCTRARAAGHKVWIDFGLQPLHVGRVCFGRHNTYGGHGIT